MRIRLSGDEAASIQKAMMILKAARKEAVGKEPSLKNRQAAEKIWLAVTTAADAMVGPTRDAGQVFKAFGRAWGSEGETLARDVQNALHVGCFYSDSKGCNGPYVDGYAVRVGRLISRRPRDSRIRARIANISRKA